MCESPIDLYKSQMQVQIIRAKTVPGFKQEFTGVADAARKIIAQNGLIRGSYQVGVCLLGGLSPVLFICLQLQGFSPTLLRNILSGGTYFMVFDTLRLERARVHGCTIKELPVLETFVCGGIAGLPFFILRII